MITREFINKNIKKGFFYLNIKSFDEATSHLTNAEKFVLLILMKFKNKNSGLSFPTLDLISDIMSNDEVNIKKQFVSRVITSLQDKKVIDVLRNDNPNYKTCRNMYRVRLALEEGFEDKLLFSFLKNRLFDWEERLFLIKIYPHIFSITNEMRFTKKELSKKVNISYPTILSKINKLLDMGVLKTNVRGGFIVDLEKIVGISESEFVSLTERLLGEIDKLKTELIELKKKQDGSR